MTGTIERIAVSRTFCFIRADGKEYFAHKRDFADPSIMKERQIVTFTPKKIGPPEPGQPHPVTDVIAA